MGGIPLSLSGRHIMKQLKVSFLGAGSVTVMLKAFAIPIPHACRSCITTAISWDTLQLCSQDV